MLRYHKLQRRLNLTILRFSSETSHIKTELTRDDADAQQKPLAVRDLSEMNIPTLQDI